MLGQCVPEQDYNQRMSRQGDDSEALWILTLWHLTYSVIRVLRAQGFSTHLVF